MHSRQEAADFISEVGEVAVKPTGLTGGKGVQVMGTQLMTVEDALNYIDEWLTTDGVVLLEERLVGEEFSRMVFASDEKIAPVSVAQDFKYAYEGDNGFDDWRDGFIHDGRRQYAISDRRQSWRKLTN